MCTGDHVQNDATCWQVVIFTVVPGDSFLLSFAHIRRKFPLAIPEPGNVSAGRLFCMRAYEAISWILEICVIEAGFSFF